MRFALEWHDRHAGPSQTPRRFLDYIIEGDSLYEQHGEDVIGHLGWLPAEWDELAAMRLPQHEAPDVDDRVALYVCPECADLLCGAITAVIERDCEEIVWRALAVSYFDHLEGKWDHDSTGLAELSRLCFPATAYFEAITARPRPPH
jgi:hypothetical protein